MKMVKYVVIVLLFGLLALLGFRVMKKEKLNEKSEKLGWKYFTMAELDPRGEANDEQIKHLDLLVKRVLDPLRELYGKPIHVNCGFRSWQKNSEIQGSSNTSFHLEGFAVDIEGYDYSNAENKILFDLIRNNLPYTELINEFSYSWVHVAYNGRNAKEILSSSGSRINPNYSKFYV